MTLTLLKESGAVPTYRGAGVLCPDLEDEEEDGHCCVEEGGGHPFLDCLALHNNY